MNDAALDKAEFCLHIGIAPSEYDGLTLRERNAFVRVHNKMNQKR